MRHFHFFLFSLFMAPAFGFGVVDDHGVLVQFNQSPQRVVSMLPSVTETVCILGKCSKLIGVDRYSNWPKEVDVLPKMGGGLDPNIEAIIALKPDLVLVGSSPRASERLRSLGVKVFSIDAKSYSDVHRTIEKLATIFEVSNSEAQKIWSDIEIGITRAAKTVPQTKTKRRVYFEVNRAPYAAGPSSFIGETLERLGLENIIPRSLGPFPKLNPEYVVHANPDFIMVGDKNYAGMVDRPAWDQIKAIQDGNVCIFNAEEADVIVRPGPRISQGAEAIAKCLSKRASTSSLKGMN